MSIPEEIRTYLDSRQVEYQYCKHSPAFTAQGVAHAQHVSGKQVAKVVIAVAEDRKLMLVLPANRRVEFRKLEELTHCEARLATEEEFGSNFPHCEVGAMPPFGNLYDMEVWVDSSLRDQTAIIFNAGTHLETIQMSFADFERLVQPKLGNFCS